MIDKAVRVGEKFSHTKENHHSGFSAKEDRILGWCAALAALVFALALEFGPDIGSYFFHR
jgi:hypothetical protein